MVSYDQGNGGCVGVFLDMVWFQVYGGVSVILGNGYEIKEQNCVARLQGRVLWVWPHYRNFCWVYDVLGETYLTSLSGLACSKSKLPFRRSVIVSLEKQLVDFGFVKPVSKSNAGRDKRSDFGIKINIKMISVLY